MVQIADPFGVGGGVGFAVFAGENGDQPAIARVEVKVIVLGHVQVGLLKHEGHPQYPFPKINRTLPIRSNKGNVMNTLSLYFTHDVSFFIKQGDVG
ncbi:MAG: hypothetical protein V9G20_11895 [Candidatus Promineifilaceae bacterium]